MSCDTLVVIVTLICLPNNIQTHRYDNTTTVHGITNVITKFP